jgi:DNA polymerase-1
VIHYSIHSTGARQTGRSSVTAPPMQTYDRDEPAVRGSYRPRPGHVFVTIDADQIEMRETAHCSRDPRLIADFLEADRTGQSFFLIAASKIYGEQITKKDPRYTMTKNASYAQNFGAGLEKAAVTAGVTEAQMRPAYDGFRQQYPGVNRLMNRLIAEARGMSRPGVKTLGGRWLYCYPGKEYSLQNYLMQGSAAEILKRGVIALDAHGFGPFLRLPVHDEIIMECPAAEAQDVLAEAERILTDRDNYAVPLTWSGSILADRWRKT